MDEGRWQMGEGEWERDMRDGRGGWEMGEEDGRWERDMRGGRRGWEMGEEDGTWSGRWMREYGRWEREMARWEREMGDGVGDG